MTGAGGVDYNAARLGDPIAHSRALEGFIVGAVIGLAVGTAMVAATVATGGLALVAAAGGAMATIGGLAELGKNLGSTINYTTGTIIAYGSPNVHINGRPAARAKVDKAKCSRDGPPAQVIAQGSKTVFINGQPAARLGDRLVCDGSISAGSDNVLIGAEPEDYLAIHGEMPKWLDLGAHGFLLIGTLMAFGAGGVAAYLAEGICGLASFGGTVIGGMVGGAAGGAIGGTIGQAIGGERGRLIGEAIGGAVGGFVGAGLGARATEGHPVDAATGEVFTEATDFRVNGALPLTWSRVWMSSSTIDGALGSKWHHGFDMALYRWVEGGGWAARLADGRLAVFPEPGPGRPVLNSVERLILGTEGGHYWLIDYDGLKYHFGGRDSRTGLQHLIRIDDPNDNTLVFRREPGGAMQAIEDSAGRVFTVTNDPSGRIAAIDGPHPDQDGATQRLVTYTYDAAGDLIEARDARGASWHYRYDNHLLVEERRRGGLGFYFTWDDPARGGRARCVDTWGDGGLYRARLDYDTEAQVTVATTGRGAVRRYRWNRLGLIEEEVDPLGAVTLRDYDVAGHVLRLTRPAGDTIRFTYDDFGRLAERVDPAGGTLRLAYGLATLDGIGHGNPTRIEEPGGLLHVLTYDERGNLARYTDASGSERRFARDVRGRTLAVWDRLGVIHRFDWSASGDLVAEGTERGTRRRYAHDRLGRVVSMARGEDVPIRLVRDANGNPVEIRRPDGGVVALDYDAEDRVVRHRDALGRDTRWRYDGLPFPLERIAADGTQFRYAYDSELNLIGLENPKGERYRLDYDAAGRLVCEVGFDERRIDYLYDAAGRLIEERDAGRATAFRRDALGRLVEKLFADGTTCRYAWDTAGRLAQAANDTRDLRFVYDPAGRLLAEIQDDQTLRHAYDARGRRVSTLLPDGRRLDLGYGADNLVARVDFAGEAVARFTRDAAGRETERWAGAVRQVQEFDPQGRLTRQHGFSRRAGTAVFARDYRYDGADAITAIEDALRGMKRYRYDAIDRLIGVDGAAPESFVVDPAGNILASGPDRAGHHGEARGDRLLIHGDRKFDYDVHGNRVRERRAAGGGVERHYRFGPDNQLLALDESSRLGRRLTRFGYDALGRRVWKESAARPAANDAAGPSPAAEPVPQRTCFLWDGNVLLAESATADPLAVIYLHEPGSFRPLAQLRRPAPDRRAALYHYHLDHLGTPQEVTNDNGDVVWAADFKAWGGLARTYVATIENPIRFQGQYHDAETGLHYNRFRYYSPDEGCFIQQDPIRLAGGGNLAAYVSNPVQWVDPWGLAGDPATATHVTYQGIDSETGKPYVGYASMQGVQTPEDVINYRYGGDFSRFGGTAPDALYSGYGQAGKDTARGLEQRTFEANEGLEGTANKQNPVGPGNARGAQYLEAADNYLDEKKGGGGCM